MSIHSLKITRALTLGHWHTGPVTNKAVLSQIPDSVISECPARIIAQVGDAISAAYHAGRASMGAEIVEDDCLWIESIGKLIPLELIRAIAVNDLFPDP